MKTNIIWQRMLQAAREWRKANPDFARVLNPNNHYLK